MDPRLTHQDLPGVMHQGPLSHQELMDAIPPHIDARTAQTALNGEFVHLEHFLNCDTNDYQEVRMVDSSNGLQIKSSRPRKMITSFYKWIEAWGYYEVLLTCHYGIEIFIEMAKYRAFLLDLCDKYKIPYILNYDERFRAALGRRHSFDFNTFDQLLYTTILDASALRATTKCPKCGANDHSASDCPFRSSGPKGPTNQPAADKGKGKGSKSTPVDPTEVCIRYQDGTCRFQSCPRLHQCYICGGPKGAKFCPNCVKPSSAKPNSGNKPT